MNGDCFDVAVVGGGPAGSAVAALLAGRGIRVILCDAARFPRPKICGEYLSPGAVESLARLGAAAEVERLHPRRLRGMAVVSNAGTRAVGFYGGERSGMAIRRYDLDAALLEHARRSGAVVREGTKVVGLDRSGEGGFQILVRGSGRSHGEIVRARALVGADGRNSTISRRLGLRRRPRHRRWAVMAHFRDVAAPGDHGEMVVTGYGYCGINPLPGNLANVCVVVDPRRQEVRMPGRGGLAAYLRSRVQEHPVTRARLADAALVDGPWAGGPIASQARCCVGDGALLVGDAAGFYDPFTGEGIAMALRGAELAAETLTRALSAGSLSRGSLLAYAAARRRLFAGRLLLDRLLQGILPRPILAEHAARKLRADPALADLLARVAGDLDRAGSLLRPTILRRLVRV